MNIFLTGGAGYIGSVSAQALLNEGHRVTVYDALYTGHRQAVPEAAIFVQVDLADQDTLKEVIQG